jgi:hypothetical protein
LHITHFRVFAAAQPLVDLLDQALGRRQDHPFAPPAWLWSGDHDIRPVSSHRAASARVADLEIMRNLRLMSPVGVDHAFVSRSSGWYASNPFPSPRPAGSKELSVDGRCTTPLYQHYRRTRRRTGNDGSASL